MDGNNDIFLAGNNAKVLNWTNAQRNSTTVIWSYLFSVSRSYDRFFDPSHTPIVRTCTHLEYPRFLCMWLHQFDTPPSRFVIAHLP